MFARSSPLEMGPRAQLERQLAAVVGFLEDAELDELLTLAVDRFLVPLPRVTISLPAGLNAHPGRRPPRLALLLGPRRARGFDFPVRKRRRAVCNPFQRAPAPRLTYTAPTYSSSIRPAQKRGPFVRRERLIRRTQPRGIPAASRS